MRRSVSPTAAACRARNGSGSGYGSDQPHRAAASAPSSISTDSSGDSSLAISAAMCGPPRCSRATKRSCAARPVEQPGHAGEAVRRRQVAPAPRPACLGVVVDRGRGGEDRLAGVPDGALSGSWMNAGRSPRLHYGVSGAIMALCRVYRSRTSPRMPTRCSDGEPRTLTSRCRSISGVV
jgi:hypothetical protein